MAQDLRKPLADPTTEETSARSLASRYRLEYVDVGLKIYQFVRYNFIHPSFLLYRKRRDATPAPVT